MTSIIVPVYNAEKTLKRCVDSLLSQSAADYEIILVNDGSTDSSLDILNEYADQFPRRERVFKISDASITSDAWEINNEKWVKIKQDD